VLTIDRIAAGYGGQRILRELSLSIEPGQLCALVGPSGSGKTTLLRLIAGFESAMSGSLWIDGRPMAGNGVHVAPEERGVGFVFQDHALFPHLDVAANITFGLRHLPASACRKRLNELLEAVALHGLSKRYPHELSGGQQQRVALARALAPEPSILLLDEPFASLDERMRSALASEVRQILAEAGTTAVLVTHDIDEACAFADRIGMLSEGRLAQWGKPAELYRNPAHRAVAEFIGRGAFVSGEVVDAHILKTALGAIRCEEPCRYAVGTAIDVYLRAEDIIPGGTDGVPATVRSRCFRGSTNLYTLATEGIERLLSHFPHHCHHEEGEVVKISLAVRNPVYFGPAVG
jgi:iron(III) transport system ATP-binding protein